MKNEFKVFDTLSVLFNLESNVVIGTEVSQILVVEVGMALILENCGLIFLGAHKNLLDLPPGTLVIYIMSA